MDTNKELASKYRTLQNDLIARKNALLNKYDKKVKIEEANKDLKQVKLHYTCLEIPPNYKCLHVYVFTSIHLLISVSYIFIEN